MNAAEIRAIKLTEYEDTVNSGWNKSYDIRELEMKKFLILNEIAAQLAEFNERCAVHCTKGEVK